MREELVEIRIGSELVGVGYEFERSQTVLWGSTEHTWTERVLIVRSESIAENQARRWSVGWPRPKSRSVA